MIQFAPIKKNHSNCFRYGMSFIEQVSLNHISPWLSGGDNVDGNSNGVTGQHTAGQNGGVIPECKGKE